jgi:hypothetical protein
MRFDLVFEGGGAKGFGFIGARKRSSIRIIKRNDSLGRQPGRLLRLSLPRATRPIV